MNRQVPANQIHTTQVLVVGGGGAGIRAAIAASEEGQETMLVLNGKLFGSGSTFYELSPAWGIMSSRDSREDVQDFYEDVLRAANGCVSPGLLRILCEESFEAVEDLKSYGIPLRPLSELGVTPCFGKAPRGYALADLTVCAERLGEKLRSLGSLTVVEEVSVVSLLTEGGVCNGAVGFDQAGGMHLFRAGATVLACGGAENLYKYSYRNGKNNGAAYAMAARHGARIVNLEFIQFINATLAPVQGLNYNQHLLVTQPGLQNTEGQPFMERYLPEGVGLSSVLKLRASHGPFSITTDSKYFDLAIVKESQRTKKPGAVVRADAEKLVTTEFRLWTKLLESQGIAPGDAMTVYPHCHAFNGGILLAEDGTTDIGGLFACGESAGGCHGANRMGGNAMLGTQVFGKLAGKAAAAFSRRKLPELSLEDAEASLRQEGCLCGGGRAEPEAVMESIQNIMQASGFLMRDEDGLQTGLHELEALSLAYDPALYLGSEKACEAFEVFNALCAARLILTAMRCRRESRGGHYRTDYPERSEELAGMQAVTFTNGYIYQNQVTL